MKRSNKRPTTRSTVAAAGPTLRQRAGAAALDRLGAVRQSLKLRAGAAFVLGAASVLAYAPIGWYLLIFATLGGLFALLSFAADANAGARARAVQGALIGAVFAFGLFIAGVSWVYVSLSTFGNMAAPLAAVATFLFCAVLALFPALAGALFAVVAPPALWQRSVLFAAAWTLAEWLRGWVFTGFPWLATGYSQAPPSPLAGFAALAGVYGVSFLTALSAALVYAAVLRSLTPTAQTTRVGRWQTAWPALAVLVVFIGGEELRAVRWTTPVGRPLSVALVQGNIAQSVKWLPEAFAESLAIYHRLVSENPAQLTVLPETALPAFLNQLPAPYLEELHRLALRENGDLVMGTMIGDNRRYANAAIAIGSAGEQLYEKKHLVPFGEFVPPGFAWALALVNIPMSSFTAGAGKQAPLSFNGQKAAINICYEDAFGEEIIGALPAATLLVNLSNVAWFGDSLAPAQHLQMAQLRALETGRMVLRATNTGMTAIIGSDGQVISQLKPFTRDVLRGEVSGFGGSTPYVRWGNWPTVIGALLLIALSWRRKAESTEPEATQR